MSMTILKQKYADTSYKCGHMHIQIEQIYKYLSLFFLFSTFFILRNLLEGASPILGMPMQLCLKVF